MPSRLKSSVLAILWLALALLLSSCSGVESGTSEGVAVASNQPVASTTPVALPQPTRISPTASATPTSVATATAVTTTTIVSTVTDATTAASAPTATGVAQPSPTSPQLSPTSPPPAPTSSPVPPTFTATPISSSSRSPEGIRLELRPIVGGLERPVGIANAGDGSGRLFILEQVGRIRIVQDGVLRGAPFLDITGRVGSSGNEQGLIGLAFDPAYAVNGYFYVNYTDLQGDTVVARFSVSADAGQADPASESVVLTILQPASNHNGGHLAFGPDGYLYIGTGDGGGAGDRFGNGQNGATLLGAMLRLDVGGAQPYAIPADNPFVGEPAVRDEIWAIGLRNPWRYAFDRATGDLYIADVGQNQYEEVNYQQAAAPGGQNYGWPIMEGMHCFPESRVCEQAGLIRPVAEYDHSLGCSVTGGYVYRGQESPALSGIYLFGDYCSGRIWGLAAGQDGAWKVAELAQTGMRLSSFGEDEGGELYLLDMGGGELFKIAASSR
jgi:glucose/arabinose dehydrogenase